MGDKATGIGPKFNVDVEGTLHPWDADTITTAQIADLGGFPVSEGVVEVDTKTQEERTLGPDEVVALRPGQGFAKKVKFKRG